jgi:hypothetical protein
MTTAIGQIGWRTGGSNFKFDINFPCVLIAPRALWPRSHCGDVMGVTVRSISEVSASPTRSAKQPQVLTGSLRRRLQTRIPASNYKGASTRYVLSYPDKNVRIGANQRLSDNYHTFDTCGHFAPQVSFMLRAVFFGHGCQFIEPIDELGIAATLTNEAEDIAGPKVQLLTPTSRAHVVHLSLRQPSQG